MASAVLCAGALTPDSAVFLGPVPFGRIATGPPAIRTIPSPHAGFVSRRRGSVWAAPGRSARTSARSSASLVDVARQCGDGDGIDALSAAEVDELVNWEAEKWRQQLKR